MAEALQERPMKITKDIYPILARKYKSTPSNVEHNIRTLINLCWMSHRETLEEIAGCTMEDKPTNSEFIDILAYYLYSSHEKTAQVSEDQATEPEMRCVVLREISGLFHPINVPDAYPDRKKYRTHR